MRSAHQRRLRVIPASVIGEERYISAGGQRVRVNVRQRTGVPLVLCNGIGASMEVLDPLVEQLDSTVVRFDVPGTGGSPTSPLPYGFPYLAWVLGRVLSKLDIGVVDVLGLSWGGALAQQFAFQNPRRCRRLVLVATGTGALMVPAHPGCWRKCLRPGGFRIPTTPHPLRVSCTVAPSGLTARTWRNCSCGRCAPDRRSATCTNCSRVPFGPACSRCPRCGRRRLIVAGTDDPIIPVVNARIMHALLPHSLLHLHSGGHIDLVHNAAELAPVIERIPERTGRTAMSDNDIHHFDTSDFYCYEHLLTDEERDLLHAVRKCSASGGLQTALQDIVIGHRGRWARLFRATSTTSTARTRLISERSDALRRLDKHGRTGGTMTNAKTVHEVTYDLLRELGLTTVFGNPGSTEQTFLKNFPDDFTYVLGLQEASVLAMADGFAQSTGKPALVNVHTAAGMGNAMGNLVAAYKGNTPLIVTAGQQTREMVLCEPYLTNKDETVFPQPWVKWAYEPSAPRTCRPRSCAPTQSRCSHRPARCFCPSRLTTGRNRRWARRWYAR